MPSNTNTKDMQAVPQFKEPVDLALLASYEEIQVDGDPDLIAELIDLYLEDAPRRVASMRESLSRIDLPSVKRGAHGLRGSSGSLGVLQIALICSEIEAAEGTESFSTLAALLSCLERELERVVPIFLAERQRRLR